MKLIGEIDAVLEENRSLRKQVEELESERYNNGPKLTRDDVSKIRDLRRAGYKIGEIAEIYDVNKSTISRTVRGIYH